MNRPQVVSEQEWQAARDALLIKEKECTRALDALAAERRRLPMVLYGRQEQWEDSPEGWPQDPTMSWLRPHDEY